MRKPSLGLTWDAWAFVYPGKRLPTRHGKGERERGGFLLRGCWDAIPHAMDWGSGKLVKVCRCFSSRAHGPRKATAKFRDRIIPTEAGDTG